MYLTLLVTVTFYLRRQIGVVLQDHFLFTGSVASNIAFGDPTLPPERVEDALRLVCERFAEERSGIVLEHVAGGWAFRASRAEAAACARLFERPAQRNLSQAALETLAVVAYLGPCSRPDIARIRGVAAESAVANLVERGLIAEAGRDNGVGGAVRYRTTPLFERVFGLESLSELPRLDEVGADADEIRNRLYAVAEKRSA